jgi:hypothetical protein
LGWHGQPSALRIIKVGGRGQWRIGTSDLDSYIEHAYRARRRSWQPTLCALGPDAIDDGDIDGGIDDESVHAVEGHDQPFLDEA